MNTGLIISALIGVIVATLTYVIAFGADSLSGDAFCLLPLGMLFGFLGGSIGSSASKWLISTDYYGYAGYFVGAVLGGLLSVFGLVLLAFVLGYLAAMKSPVFLKTRTFKQPDLSFHPDRS